MCSIIPEAWNIHAVIVMFQHDRSGKSTCVSMISNSITHLRSYTNTAIADIAENSTPVTPRDYRRLRIGRRRLRIKHTYRRIK